MPCYSCILGSSPRPSRRHAHARPRCARRPRARARDHVRHGPWQKARRACAWKGWRVRRRRRGLLTALEVEEKAIVRGARLCQRAARRIGARRASGGPFASLGCRCLSRGSRKEGWIRVDTRAGRRRSRNRVFMTTHAGLLEAGVGADLGVAQVAEDIVFELLRYCARGG